LKTVRGKELVVSREEPYVKGKIKEKGEVL
jgi:hypothetical protein